MPARILHAVQQIHRRASDCLSAEIHIENAADIRIVSPVHLDRRAVMKHHDTVLADGGNRSDQRDLILRHPHRSPVISFGFKGFRKSDKEHRHIAVHRHGERLAEKLLVRLLLRCVIAAGIGHGQSVRLCRLKRGLHAEAVDMRASASLIARLFGKLAEEGHLCFPAERQNRPVEGRASTDVSARDIKQRIRLLRLRALLRVLHIFILQQNCALRLDVAGHAVLCLHIPGRLRLLCALVVIDKTEHTPHALIHFFLIETAVPHRFHNRGIVLSIAARHLQVKPGVHALRAVADSAPVTDDKALKAPFTAEHIVQQPAVFRNLRPVQLVVGAHHHIGLRLFDNNLECAQINLAQRPLIHL